MIKTVEEEGCKWYMLDEDEYCEYQGLKKQVEQWRQSLADATDAIKAMREGEIK